MILEFMFLTTVSFWPERDSEILEDKESKELGYLQGGSMEQDAP